MKFRGKFLHNEGEGETQRKRRLWENVVEICPHRDALLGVHTIPVIEKNSLEVLSECVWYLITRVIGGVLSHHPCDTVCYIIRVIRCVVLTPV